MKKIMVTFDVFIDDDIPYLDGEFIQEWLEYELNLDCVMSERNPLCGKNIESINVDFEDA